MYESSTSTVTGALESSANPVLHDQTVINEIITLTTSNTGGVTDNTVTISEVAVNAAGDVVIPANTEVAMITLPTAPTGGVVQVSPTEVKNVPVLIFQGDTAVDLSLNDGATAGAPGVTATAGATTAASGAQRVVVMGSGSSKVTISDAKNTKLTLGTGNSTVVTGHGVDTVVAGLGNSTITGGNSDYSVVKLAAAASNYTVDTTTTAGHAIVTDKITGVHTDITKIQYVETAGNDALIFAKSTTEASIATLFEVAYGRTADSAGLNYYYDLAQSGATLKQIADALVKSAEFGPRALLDDTNFVNSLYMNTFGRNGETAGMNYWLDAMHNHGATRADIIRSFAEVHTLNLQGGAGPGALHEATLVGNVTIVSGII